MYIINFCTFNFFVTTCKRPKLKYILTYFFLLVNSLLFAQNGISQLGARPAAMGYAYATESDSWTIYNNPGGIGKLREVSALFAYENKYSIPGLSVMGAGFITRLPLGTAGLSVFRFGDDLYNEQMMSLSYGNQFGIASLGIRANYLQYTIEGFGNKGIVSIDFGGIAHVTENLIFGAFIRNINQAKVADLADERAPTLLNAGLSYRPIDRLHINIEAEKDLDYDASMRIGMEYLLYKTLAIRTGVSTRPFTSYAGLGFTKGKFQLDYALTKKSKLGYCHQASVVFKIKSDQ